LVVYWDWEGASCLMDRLLLCVWVRETWVVCANRLGGTVPAWPGLDGVRGKAA
jgi:hypothetical protein